MILIYRIRRKEYSLVVLLSQCGTSDLHALKYATALAQEWLRSSALTERALVNFMSYAPAMAILIINIDPYVLESMAIHCQLKCLHY